MKRKIFLCFLLAFSLFFITGCEDKKEENNNQISDRDKCCSGCVCGDTIELLKNIETAWTLTEVDASGEYVYDKHSFINFHDNRFAFFKNDENLKPISEIRGNYSITKNDEVLLKLDNSDKEITCKLGAEKDLIAILECDNDFGTFTLQKIGTLDLPDIIKDTVSKTKTIIVNGKSIKDQNDIDVLISVINGEKVYTGPVTLPSPLYKIELLDSDNNSLAKIDYNPEHYFTMNINGRNYELTRTNKDLLKSILEK